MTQFFELLRDLKVVRSFRSQISSWPGYQQKHELSLKHHLKMITRETLGYLSESFRMTKDQRARIDMMRDAEGTYFGEVLFLGTGPSLKNLDIEQINYFRSMGGKVASLNGFLRTKIASEIKPDFYFIGDPEYWNESSKESREFKFDLERYLSEDTSDVTLVLPANRDPLTKGYFKVLYWDHRNLSGVRRLADPTKPWGLSASVSLISISTLKFLGFHRIYFAGLDSNMHLAYFVNHLNQLVTDHSNHYEYSSHINTKNFNQEYLAENVQGTQNTPIRHVADLFYAQATFFHDMYWLFGENCINVGNDFSNDVSNRACLVRMDQT